MNNIIFIIICFVISDIVIIYLQNKNCKKIIETISKIKIEKTDLTPVLNKIDGIKIPEVDISILQKQLENNKNDILKEIKRVNAGEIQIENGKIKGNLFVDGNIEAKNNITAFVGGDE